MKSIKLLTKGQLSIENVLEPRIKEKDEVKIKVHCASICADDLLVFNGVFPLNGYYNHGIGHEFSGEIVDVGKEVAQMGLFIGTKVSGLSWLFCGKCPYCMRGMENMCINMPPFTAAMDEYIILKDRQVCILPPNVSMEAGCLTELVSSCMHGIDRIGIRPGNSLLIIGGGGAGQIMLQLAQMQGAARITVSEPVESKRLLAQKLGADYVIDPINQDFDECTSTITDYLGYDYIIDASGDPNVVNKLSHALAKNGTLLLFSLYDIQNNISLNMSEMYVKGGTVQFSYMAPFMLYRTMEILPKLNLDSLIVKKFTIDDVQKGFEAYASGLYPRVLIKIS